MKVYLKHPQWQIDVNLTKAFSILREDNLQGHYPSSHKKAKNQSSCLTQLIKEAKRNSI